MCFDVDYTNREEAFQETEKFFNKIEGIDSFYKLFKDIYDINFLCWGDDQIDELAYFPNESKLTVRICSHEESKKHLGRNVKYIFWMIDFYGVEIKFFDIAPEHFIDDIVIKQNADGKYSISFGSGELDFRYEYAKVNRS